MSPAILPLSRDEIAIRCGNTGHFISGEDALKALLMRNIQRCEPQRIRQESDTQEMDPIEPTPQIPSVSRWIHENPATALTAGLALAIVAGLLAGQVLGDLAWAVGHIFP
jgi:hypothetical protein